jgi:hypothetical protein
MPNRNSKLQALAKAGVPWAAAALRRAQVKLAKRNDAWRAEDPAPPALPDGDRTASEAAIRERIKLLEDSLRVFPRKEHYK